MLVALDVTMMRDVGVCGVDGDGYDDNDDHHRTRQSVKLR